MDWVNGFVDPLSTSATATAKEILTILLWLLVISAVVGIISAALRGRVMAILSFMALFVVRLAMVGNGYVVSPGAIWGLNLLLGAMAIGTLLAFRPIRASPGPRNNARAVPSSLTADQRTTLIASLLAVPVAAISLAQVLSPPVPAGLGVGGCAGASIAGSEMQGLTGSFGLNARSGPATTYPSSSRFGKECAVGLDAYCIGEPIKDSLVGVPDVRWLRLHNTDIYAASPFVSAITSPRALGERPEARCPGGTVLPAFTEGPRLQNLDSSHVALSGKVSLTPVVGVSIWYLDSQRVLPLRGAPRTSPNGETVDIVILLDKINESRREDRQAILVASPCLAANSPSPEGQYYFRFNFDSQGFYIAGDDELKADQRSQLLQSACRVDPAKNGEELEAVASQSLDLS